MMTGKLDHQIGTANGCQFLCRNAAVIAVLRHSRRKWCLDRDQHRGGRPRNYSKACMAFSDVVEQRRPNYAGITDTRCDDRQGRLVPVPLVRTRLLEEQPVLRLIQPCAYRRHLVRPQWRRAQDIEEPVNQMDRGAIDSRWH